MCNKIENNNNKKNCKLANSSTIEQKKSNKVICYSIKKFKNMVWKLLVSSKKKKMMVCWVGQSQSKLFFSEWICLADFATKLSMLTNKRIIHYNLDLWSSLRYPKNENRYKINFIAILFYRLLILVHWAHIDSVYRKKLLKTNEKRRQESTRTKPICSI